MITFAAPLWLAGLAVLPGLWWLHRHAQAGLAVYVASISLWPATRTAADASPRPRRSELDPAFWRRALLVLALVGALARPGVPTAAPEIVVWIDDAASLRTQEAGGTRLALGLAAVARELGTRGARVATLRSLSDAAWVRAWEPPYRVPADLPDGVPRPPPPATLAATAEHWLLTDGVRDAVSGWAAAAPLARVFDVGEATENAAVVRLSARPTLATPREWTVDVEVANAGRQPASRTLELRAGNRTLASEAITVAPDSTTTRRTRLPVDAGAGVAALALTASLAPHDALAQDDALALDMPAHPGVAVAVDPRCGPVLRAATLAHPGLRPAAGGEPVALWVGCGGSAPEGAGARLRVRRDAARQPVAGVPRWTDATGTRAVLPVPTAALQLVGAPLETGRGDRVLLVAGARPLVVARDGPAALLDTALDLTDPSLAALPGYPLLVASLLERAIGAGLGDGYAASRDRAAAHIERHTRTTVAGAAARPDSARRDLTPALLIIAALLTIAETLASARRVRALSRHYAASTP